MKEDKNSKIHSDDKTDLNEILDKMLKLQEGNKAPSFLKKTVYVIAGICIVLFVLLICGSIYKNSFTSESILATLLAFFSIFISIFFYFKADETSTRFYDSSYKFMKDISVTLGKIEERFGEKLNSLNDKVSHLDMVSKETSEEIEDKQEDKDKIINELMEKANLNEEQKAKYRRDIEAKEAEIEQLREHRYQAEREAAKLRRKINETSEERISTFNIITPSMLIKLMAAGKAPNDISVRTYNILRKSGYIDSEGNADRERIMNDLKQENIV